ncbi:MAG: hypothetical protein RLZZ422_495 [Pseudomonadota bacterium]|jgi:cytochrome c556
MLKKMILPFTLACALMGLTTAAHSADESPAEMAKEYRQGAFQITKYHFSQMGAVVKGNKEFNAEEFKKNAEVVAMMSHIVGNGFGEGSTADDSDAKPNIWTDAEGFKSKLQAFQTEADALVKASEAGKLDDVKPQFGKVAETCKACHKEYRAD